MYILQAQDKVESELRKLTKLDGNKTCADCPEKMPGYVNLTHHTFVCTRCSGIHRELQFKVKGISMSVFTAGDVSDLAVRGNAIHNASYMARYQPRDFTLPNGSDIGKLREFIKAKYIDKKWCGSTNERSTSHSSNNDSSQYKDKDDYSGNTTSDSTHTNNSSNEASGDLWGLKPSSFSNKNNGSIKVILDSFFLLISCCGF